MANQLYIYMYNEQIVAKECSLGVCFKGRASNEELVGQNANGPHVCGHAIIGLGPLPCRGILGRPLPQACRNAHNLHSGMQQLAVRTWSLLLSFGCWNVCTPLGALGFMSLTLFPCAPTPTPAPSLPHRSPPCWPPPPIRPLVSCSLLPSTVLDPLFFVPVYIQHGQ